MAIYILMHEWCYGLVQQHKDTNIHVHAMHAWCNAYTKLIGACALT
jgi:hypothetical protein